MTQGTLIFIAAGIIVVMLFQTICDCLYMKVPRFRAWANSRAERQGKDKPCWISDEVFKCVELDEVAGDVEEGIKNG